MKQYPHLAWIMAALLLAFSASSVFSDDKSKCTFSDDPSFHEVEVIIDDEVISRGDIMEIIDPLWWCGITHKGPVAYDESLAQFSKHQQLVHAILWYDAEVLNGGHHQFFSNSAGIVWENALEGLQKIGMSEAAEILKDASNLFGGGPSLDRAVRNRQLERIDYDALDQLDARYYNLYGSIDENLLDYIHRNRQKFYFNGIVSRPKDWNDRIQQR